MQTIKLHASVDGEPASEQMIIRRRAEVVANHDAWCRGQAARASVQRNQEAVADTQRAVTDAGIRLRGLIEFPQDLADTD